MVQIIKNKGLFPFLAIFAVLFVLEVNEVRARVRWDDVEGFEQQRARLSQLLNEFDGFRPSQKFAFTPAKPEPLPWASALKAPSLSGPVMNTEDQSPHKETEKGVNPQILVNLCENKRCSAGEECHVTNNLAECRCVKECGLDSDPRRRVCSNFNHTFDTDCHLYKKRCECNHNQECDQPQWADMHIDYYGECRDLPECKADELVDFPRRMREWLFNVMHELAQRGELNEHFRAMENEADHAENQRVKWRNAAIWKWCALNAVDDPLDNAISRHELFPVKAPLKALEHCIGDFLDSCDADSDNSITLQEWGRCLQLDEDELVARCEALNEED